MRAVLVGGAFLSVFALTSTQPDDPPKAKPEAASVKRLKADLKLLEEQLRDQDPKVRREAAETLGQLADEVHEMARPLDSAFGRDDENDEVALALIKAVSQIGRSGKPWIGIYLERYLKHESGDVRLAAAQTVVRLGKWQAAPDLIPLLKDSDARVREYAAAALASFGLQARVAAPALMDILRNPKEELFSRQCAAQALGKMGPWGKPALSLLIETFKNTKNGPTLRTWALMAVGQLAPGDKAVVEWLIELLGDKQDFSNRHAAVGALEQMGPEARAAVPALVAALLAEDVKPPALAESIRRQIVVAVPAIGPDAGEAVPHLAEILKNKKLSPDLRKATAWALGQLGPVAKDAVAALREAAGLGEGEDIAVALEAKAALAKVER